MHSASWWVLLWSQNVTRSAPFQIAGKSAWKWVRESQTFASGSTIEAKERWKTFGRGFGLIFLVFGDQLFSAFSTRFFEIFAYRYLTGKYFLWKSGLIWFKKATSFSLVFFMGLGDQQSSHTRSVFSSNKWVIWNSCKQSYPLASLRTTSKTSKANFQQFEVQFWAHWVFRR